MRILIVIVAASDHAGKRSVQRAPIDRHPVPDTGFRPIFYTERAPVNTVSRISLGIWT